MNPRHHILAMIVGGMLLLLFLGVGYLLFLKIKDYHAADSQLQGSLNQQQELYNRSPFPSSDNIAREQANLTIYKEEFAKLLKILSESQVEPVEQKPAAFNDQFWKVLKELKVEAKSKNVDLPDDFAFSFQRHMAGNLPPHPDVPRLTQQLLIMQCLCQLLFDAKITELKTVIREEFEGGVVESVASGVPNPSSRRGRSGTTSASVSENLIVKDAGLIPDNALYGKMHFGFSFTAREAVVRDLLNQIARHPMVIVVTRLEIAASDIPALKSPQGSASSGDQTSAKSEVSGSSDEVQGKSKDVTAGVPDRDQRILCGRENAVSVIMELDVYRFRKSEGNPQS